MIAVRCHFKAVYMCFCVWASLTRVQALGDRGRFNQVTSTQVTGDEMVKVSHQVLPSCSSHIWSIFATVQQDTDKVMTEAFVTSGASAPGLQLDGTQIISFSLSRSDIFYPYVRHLRINITFNSKKSFVLLSSFCFY